MIKVTSKRDLEFKKLNWSIAKGEEKELPEDKVEQEAILAHWAISEVGGESTSKQDDAEKETASKVGTKKETGEK